VTPSQVLLITQQGDPTLNARLEKLWGKLPGAGTPEKDQRIAEVRGMLPEGDKGDPRRGRKVFEEQCANCHRLFGQGAAIGPDLSGAERGDLEFLLASVVDPSRVMRKEYQPVTVATKDGRVLTGLIVEQNDQYMVLFDSAQQKTTVPRSEIDEIKDATVSVMPEGLLDKLSEGQIRDLFRYLQSSGQ
jgi:putative heme-binding domain-containing protein